MRRMVEPPAASITIAHTFNAPVNDVWQAWTDPEMVRRWWGSHPKGVVTSVALDVRRGGRFEISFQDPSGEQHTSYGEYLRVEAITELDFTWSWRNEQNPPSLVTVIFAADGSGTRMRFVHGQLRGGSAHDYAQGWRRTFAKLDRVLS